MKAKDYIKGATAALFGREYDGEQPVERKKVFHSVNPQYNPLYGPSYSGGRIHIARQLDHRSVYMCGVPIPSGLRILSTDPPDPSSLCKNCSGLFRRGAR